MKTLRQYEQQDIDLKDPIASWALGEIVVAAIMAEGMTKADPADPTDKTWGMRQAVARFLNSAEQRGISISKSEIPPVFVAGFTAAE